MDNKPIIRLWEPLRYFADHQKQLEEFINLSGRAISLFRDTYSKSIWKNPEPGIPQEEINARIERADLAMREISTGYPLLYSQAAISLWGSLESFIRDFLVSWLANVPEAMQADQVRKIKIRLADYELMDAEERYYHIVDTLENELAAPLKQGVSRFEELLNIFDLSGNADQEIRKNLFELSNIRNVLVHRRGIADKKFIKACPWLNLKIGDRVTVTSNSYQRYLGSINLYLLNLVYKAGGKVGTKLPDFEETKSKMIGHAGAAGWKD